MLAYSTRDAGCGVAARHSRICGVRCGATAPSSPRDEMPPHRRRRHPPGRFPARMREPFGGPARHAGSNFIAMPLMQ